MNFLKKCFVAFSATAIFGYGIYAYGCADGWWGNGYNSMFTPETFVDNSYKPMFFDAYYRFYDNHDLSDYVSKNNDDVLQDWVDYIGKSESKEAIAYYLLNDTASQYISKIINQQAIDGAKYRLNTKDQQSKDFLEFLQIAKKVEQYSTNSYYYWNYENRNISKTDDKVIETIEAYFNKIQDRNEFYKNRIWFQLMKAKFYSNDISQTIKFFNKTQANQPKNMLYYRALGYVAGAYYQMGDFDKSNVLFAQIFNEIPKLRQEAVYNFHPVDDIKFKKQIEAAETKEIKAALWAMNGYYKDEFKAMQEIYKLDSKSEHINFLLTRWVNIQENAINVYQEKAISSPKNYYKEVTKEIDQNQFKWIKEVASKPELLQNPELWYLTSGYLNIFQGNHKEAEKQFNLASKLVKKNNELAKNQIRILNLVNNVSQVKKITVKEEASLIEDLNWLFYEVSKEYNYGDSFRYDYANSWVRNYLSAVYKEQGDKVMAELLKSDKIFYENDKNGQAMEDFFLKKNKTAWEEIFIGLYPYNISDIYECRGINLFYSGKLDQAIAMYEKIYPIKLKAYDYEKRGYIDKMVDYNDHLLYGNPFNGKIKDCNDCDHAAKQTVKYSSLSLLKKMKEMQQNVTEGNDVFNNALLLGNAYYNLSYFGNARAFYYNSIFGEYGSNYISKENQPKLFDLSQATKYYEIALQAASDNEQRAKITYLLTKIERNNFYYNQYFSTDSYWGYGDVMFKKWNGFKKLKQDYSDTKYYQEVIKECGYFRKYLGLEK
nr:hypothetical protein [uncultured Flavobacterium sp.]